MTVLPKNLYDCLEHPKKCAADDFWGQVRRTLNGAPLPEEQLSLMLSFIQREMQFQQSDILLDIACGNGRLAFEFFNLFKGYLGVDLSPALIAIGQKNFERPPSHMFLMQTVNDYCYSEQAPERFTKALWYSAFSYFSPHDSANVLSALHKRFSNLELLFIGTIPDRERIGAFVRDGANVPVDDPTSAIGYWYTREDFTDMARECGWDVRIVDYPPNFYQAHYRFNAALTPR